MSSWSSVAAMLNAHQQMGATAYLPVWMDLPKGFLFVAGGTGDSGDVEVQASPLPPPSPLDPTPPPPWTTVTSMVTPRFGHALCVGNSGEISLIYAIGGRSNPGAKLLSSVEGYNPAPKKPGWITMASMPKPRERAAAAQYNNLIYVAGGSNGKATDDSSPLKTLEAYNPSKNTWKKLASMHTARDGPAAVTGTDGRVYVIAGLGDSAYLSSVESYDPSTNKWGKMSSMNTPRGGPAAVLGPDGQIYVLGGQNGVETLATTEVYNFTTKTWTPGPSMSVGREFLAAVTGFDGGIYALGGYTPLLGITDSVEVLFVS